MQLLNISMKGAMARIEGVSRDQNPYRDGYRNNQGPGGGLQRQRRAAWLEGWDLENKEAEGRGGVKC